MSIRSCLILAATLIAWPPHRAAAQIEQAAVASPAAPRLGPATVTRYRTGAIVTAKRGAVRNIRAMVAAPLECPEQTVQTIEEDVSPAVRNLQYRLLPGDGARQMLVFMPYLNNGEEGRAVITYEVTTHTILPPEDPSLLVEPDRRDREARTYLGPSPYINVGHVKIKRAVRDALEKLTEELADDDASEPSEAESEDAAAEAPPAVVVTAAGSKESPTTAVAAANDNANDNENDDNSPAAGDEATAAADTAPTDPTAWQQVEAFFDYAIENVQYQEGVDKSAVQVLEEGVGDCQAIGALFVAMCRTHKIPARLVWVHDHQYAEFYLVDETGAGHWFPIETAGTPAFGEMRIARVILQKGDNFRVPERRGERLRYASDFMIGLPTPGGGKPSVKYVRGP